jgi:hypothetical protein
VIEAVAAVGGGATEAWIAETGDGFDLDANQLVALSDQGVPVPVIDLMIAVSYPDRFALAVDDERSPGLVSVGSTSARPVLGSRGVGCYSNFGPSYGSRYYGSSYYDPFYSGCGYRYSSYSYGPYGYGGGWYGSYAPVVYVGGSTAQRNPGRVVKDQGYTRGRGETSTGSTSTGSAGSAAPPRSSGGATSGTTTTRRAKPRGGGGGGL